MSGSIEDFIDVCEDLVSNAVYEHNERRNKRRPDIFSDSLLCEIVKKGGH